MSTKSKCLLNSGHFRPVNIRARKYCHKKYMVFVTKDMAVQNILIDTGEMCDKLGMYKKDTLVMWEITYDTE